MALRERSITGVAVIPFARIFPHGKLVARDSPLGEDAGFPPDRGGTTANALRVRGVDAVILPGYVQNVFVSLSRNRKLAEKGATGHRSGRRPRTLPLFQTLPNSHCSSSALSLSGSRRFAGCRSDRSLHRCSTAGQEAFRSESGSRNGRHSPRAEWPQMEPGELREIATCALPFRSILAAGDKHAAAGRKKMLR